MRDVFVCHASPNVETARQISSFLEQEGITCWIAPRDLAEGGDERGSGLTAAESCPVTVLVLSEAANNSSDVQDQVERALRAEKILIPLRIENIMPTGRMETALRHRFRHDAFVGPLDRHLAELVRMLKPLLHRLVVRTREATSISRTLPSRSSIVRGAENGGGASAGSLEPLVLAFHFPHPVFAGHASVVEVRAAGQSSLIKGSAVLTLEGLGLKRRVTWAMEDFAQQPRQHFRLTFDPARSGKFPLHAIVVIDNDEGRIQLAGTRDLRINPARALHDRLRLEEVVVNHDKKELCLAGPVHPGSENPTLGEVLAIEVPENFAELALVQEFAIARQALDSLILTEAWHIPEPFAGRGQPGTLLRLEPEIASPDLPFQEIRLVARSTLTVGRSREESDYVAWFWPRNEVHDTKTRRISKKHATFVREGATIAIRNVAAGSLTTFDGQDLSGSETMILDGVGTLNLSGIYELEVARKPSTLGQGGEAPHPETARGSVSFVSRTSNTLPQQTLWLLSDGTFGSSRANALQLETTGLADIQGRFHHDQGLFWIESVVDNGAVQAGDLTLERGMIVPLAHGLGVRLGGQWYRATIES